MNHQSGIRDIVYSIAALLLMNATIQLIVYPFLLKQKGEEEFGYILTLLAIISILASSLGSSAHYSRIIIDPDGNRANSDYLICLFALLPIAVVVSAVALRIVVPQQKESILLFAFLIWITILRSYCDVNYRIRLDFKGYFRYYALISLGYLLGCLLYRFTKSWMSVFAIGETFSVVSVFFGKDSVVKFNFSPTPNFKENLKSISYLALSNFTLAVVLNCDRPILLNMIDGEAVTKFYIASLIGKMISMIIVPLNGVILSYLVKIKQSLSSASVGKLIGLVLSAGVFSVFACVIVSHIYVRIVYPEMYESVRQLFWVANTGQVLYFLSSTIMMLLLRVSEEKTQLYINLVYFIIYLVSSVLCTKIFGMQGMLWSIVAVNALKLIIIIFILFRILNKSSSEVQ